MMCLAKFIGELWIFQHHTPLSKQTLPEMISLLYAPPVNAKVERKNLAMCLFIYFDDYHIYQPLRSGRIWHKVNF